VNSTIVYEQPLNERIRTLLRLEYLHAQTRVNLAGESFWNSHAALMDVLEIQNVFSRSDIKSEVIKELERLASAFEKWEQNPNVDNRKLGSLLDEIYVFIDRLRAIDRPVGQELKNNELFLAVRQRSSIPGGTCAFDLPGYHFWLQQPAERRLNDLQSWISHFDTVLQAAELILQLHRESAQQSDETAEAGFYQHTLDPSAACNLLRVTVPGTCPYYAEISGGKHRFSIRFMELKIYESDVATDEDVNFRLSLCSL
jgi:cell division protein ZapD